MALVFDLGYEALALRSFRFVMLCLFFIFCIALEFLLRFSYVTSPGTGSLPICTAMLMPHLCYDPGVSYVTRHWRWELADLYSHVGTEREMAG